MRLRDLQDGQPKDGPAVAKIVGISADGSVSVDLGGGQQVPALVIDTYTPVMGDLVAVSELTPTSWWVLGRRRTSNATTQTLAASWPLPYSVAPSVAAVANPLIVTMAESRSWRSLDGWSRDDVYQGAFSSSLGYWYGCWFPGVGQYAALQGRACTSLSVRVPRKSEGGSSGPTPVWLALHPHATRPSGQPLFPWGAINAGSLAWGATGELALPTSWGDKLLSGEASGLGLLLLASGNGNYSLVKSLALDSLSGRVTLGWV